MVSMSLKPGCQKKYQIMAFNKVCTIAHHDPVSPYLSLFSDSHLLYDLGHGT